MAIIVSKEATFIRPSVSTMGTKMKGLYKGFKYISNIFVVKERELEIGYPTDVKHVAHIGWDGQSDSGPSWMTEYKAAPDFSTASVNDMGASRNNNGIQVPSWSTRDFDQPMGGKQGSEMIKNSSLTERPKASKKQKRKKIKSAASSPRASASTSRTTSRASKTKASLGKCVSHLETLKTCKE